MDHFHLHCLVPGGALSFEKDRWLNQNKNSEMSVNGPVRPFSSGFEEKALI
jgi:hypothetical protein